MLADMAAAYCGERSIEEFLKRIGSAYPEPRVVNTTRRKFWYRDDLDRAMSIGQREQPKGLGGKFREKIGQKRHGRPAETRT
ncbi:hypothetical protein [Martelella soudanensis]|uniref:hypothetical protein n=1 Tax=unclassified Martelella TaxID=2629616 RepID=UPI0015DEDABA|nr:MULTISPECIES: hypothetical protein [unclassified Martelella]